MSVQFLVLLFLPSVYSARILAVFQFPSLSHQVVYQPIWRELSLRGHQVTVVTPNPLHDQTLTNLTEIDASELYKILHNPSDSIENTHSSELGAPSIMWSFFEVSNKLQTALFENSAFQKVYTDPDAKFDLILTELLHPGMYSLAGRFKAPLIGISSLGAIEATHFSVGNLVNPVVYPEMNYPHHQELTFHQRVTSVYNTICIMYYYNYHVLPTADRIARRYLGEDLPYLGDLGRNVSALFINTNPIIYNVRPTVPTVVQLGFMHIREPKPLDKELQAILDGAHQGAVYLSLGSNVKSANIDKNLLQRMIQDVSELPFLVLWKWETDDFPGKPKNVITRRWFPQQDVLAHPNVKAFVTQGGLQSSEEAISRGVPIVGIPFIGDQPMNVKKLAEAGMAVELEYSQMRKGHLKEAVLEVVQNPKYKMKIAEIRDIVLDQPMTSLERAVWWCEYVIRHKGTKHLKSPTADVALYQYLLLDVIAFLLIVVYVTIRVARCLIKFIFKNALSGK